MAAAPDDRDGSFRKVSSNLSAGGLERGVHWEGATNDGKHVKVRLTNQQAGFLVYATTSCSTKHGMYLVYYYSSHHLVSLAITTEPSPRR